MKYRFPVLSLLLLLGLTTILNAQIRTGSSVQISIMGVPQEEKTKIDSMYFVASNGTINMPFIGTIRAAGKRPEVLAAAIQSSYRAAQIYTNPTIQVVSTAEEGGVQEQRVHLGGQVRTPGPIPFTKGLTIYQAVQTAGGTTEFGSQRRVKLYRNGKISTLDITDPQYMRVPLQPNDTIEVERKNWLGR